MHAVEPSREPPDEIPADPIASAAPAAPAASQDGAGGASAERAAEALSTDAITGDLLRVILVASFGPLLLNLSSTTINVAIDQLMANFAAPLSTIHWIITGYLLSLTLVLPSFRWAVERLGSRRLYIGCLLAFAATSVLSAAAWSAHSLIVFRVLQGGVGGLLAPLAQTLIAQLAGPKRMGRAVGIVSIPVLVAPVLGPALGGFLIQRLSWRWLFLVNVPFGLLGAWAAYRRLPVTRSVSRARLDVVGLALLSPGIGLFTYAVSSLRRGNALSLAALVPFALSVLLIGLFVLHARRKPETALIDLRILQHRTVGAALAVYLLSSFGSFGAQLVLPLYFLQVRGESAMSAGLLLAPQGLGMLLTLPWVGKLADRFDPGKIVIAGVLVTLLGTYAFTQVTDQSSYVSLSLSLVARGAGLAATSTPALVAAYRLLSPGEVPNATAVMNIVQRLGAPLGTAAMAVTLQQFIGHVSAASVASSSASGGVNATAISNALLARAFAHTFAVSAGLSALSLVAAFALVRMPPSSSGRSTKEA